MKMFNVIVRNVIARAALSRPKQSTNNGEIASPRRAHLPWRAAPGSARLAMTYLLLGDEVGNE